ncbi:hypothetical protein CAP40_10195 [Sphingomonas sp. IBVSS2]|nr:hypothetical protein CAP40_10195 [Sphingomonas sp. IBVSS2]
MGWSSANLCVAFMIRRWLFGRSGSGMSSGMDDLSQLPKMNRAGLLEFRGSARVAIARLN